jgi:hypothetical protein
MAWHGAAEWIVDLEEMDGRGTRTGMRNGVRAGIHVGLKATNGGNTAPLTLVTLKTTASMTMPNRTQEIRGSWEVEKARRAGGVGATWPIKSEASQETAVWSRVERRCGAFFCTGFA